MHPSGDAPRSSSFRLAAVGLATVAVIGTLAVWLLSAPHSPTPSLATYEPMAMTPFITPGIQHPPILSGLSAVLPDDAAVIGVVAEGKYRAYRVDAFNPIHAHVVNNVIGETSITVTHCNRTQCTRVFSGEKHGSPLAIDLGGYLQKMFLKVDGQFYFQDTGASISNDPAKVIPNPVHPFEITTWKRWKAAHTSTELYSGAPSQP